MSTFKSRQAPGRWAKHNARPGFFERRRARIDAARIAGPSPLYPPTAPLHGDWIGGRINGHTVVMRLMRDPMRHRCDQWAAEIDGVTVADAAGLTALWAVLHKRWPRAMPLRALAGVAVLAATFDDERYYVVPSNGTNDDKFPPRGPFSKEAVVAYLRLVAK